MAAESSRRSRLIDVTYKQLHLLLSGWEVNATQEDTEEILQPRVEALKSVRKPFGKPNAESRKKVDSGAVTLRDGVVVRVEEDNKPIVFAISSKFDIDEVEALVLLRSFLYNEAVPDEMGWNTDDSFIQSLVEMFTPFYHSERRCLARLYVPLFRAHDHEGTLFHGTAQRLLPDIIPNGSTFVGDIVQEYLDLINAPLPADVSKDPRAASRWAKECLKDQLVLLEVLFWAVWEYIPHRGSIVVQIYETAYSTSLGSSQQNATLLLDEEGYRVQQDCAAIWLLIMLEILDLEFFSDHGAPDLTVPPSESDLLMKSPASLKKIHHLVVTHGDSQYAAIYLAWTIVLSNLETSLATLDECPPAYREFFDTLDPRGPRPYLKGGEPLHKLMLQRCLDPAVGLFRLLLTILTTSPVFVISISWHTDSAVTDPNSIAYRAVVKGLLIALSESMPIELIPDFDAFVEVWVTLFGRGESQSVAGICQQFWLHDALKSPARRAILDATRSRFPVHFRPLVRLLNAMTGSGFTDADPLVSVGHGSAFGLSAERSLCSRHVSVFFDALPTYTQVIPMSACTGPHALFEKLPERYGSSSVHGLTYVNTRPIILPGGTLLPARTHGRLLSQDGEDYIIVAWQREHSGWRLLVDVLADYARRRRLIPAAPPSSQERANAVSPVVLQLNDIGIEVDPDGDYSVVTDALELLRAVMLDSDALAGEVLASIDEVKPGSTPRGDAPSLVQLTMLILEDALSHSASQPRKSPDSHLITAAFSVLSSLLSAPKYTSQVWLFTRSATSLFDTSRNSANASAILAAERSSGLYPITRSLLRFIHDLYHQALSALVAPDAMERLPGAKEEVLLRALRFVHAEIWVEHNGWKYAQLGDRFEIGRLVSALYGDILEHTPPGSGAPLSTLSQAVLDALVTKANTSSIAPLIVALTTSSTIMRRINSSRRLGDLKGLFALLRMHLRVLRLCLTYKQRLYGDAGLCLLEQALCSRAGSGGSSFPSNRNQTDALDVLATLAEDSSADLHVPLESIRVLSALCMSLSMSQPTAPTILGHLSDPQSTVTQLVKIAHHPYQEADVRVAVWRFMALAVEREPALGNLFIAGRLRISDNRTTQEFPDKKSKEPQPSGLEAASAVLLNWEEYWNVNPELLSAALGFLSVVWERGLEHKGMLEATRKDADFWDAAAGIVKEDLSPTPLYQSTEYMGPIDNGPRSMLHESISTYASQVLCKAQATRIIAFDIDLDRASSNSTEERAKPQSYQAVEAVFKSEDMLSDLVSDAVATAYDPTLYDGLAELVKTNFPSLALEYFESRLLPMHREFGDAFAFSLNMLRGPLHSSDMTDEAALEARALVNSVFSINLNLSLTHAFRELGQSWRSLLVTTAPFLRGVSAFRPVMLALAAEISSNVANEERSGELMSDIHGVRLSLVLALLELAWFSSTDSQQEREHFIKLLGGVHDMVVSEAHPPIQSVRGSIATPFHRTLLQIIYFCARQSRNMAGRPKFLTADNRLAIASMVDSMHVFVIDSLRFVFEAARTRLDTDTDVDLELLVAVFKECTRRDISSSSTLWLTRCQETDVIRASLELFVQTDLTGLSTLSSSRRKQPLYSPHILTFHIALASLPAPAERLASEGVLIAYSNSRLGPGPIDVTLPELPGERNPAHTAYCVMLAVVSGVFSSLGMQKHFFGAEASGFVRLFGNQIAGVLAWTVGDPLSLALVEEMERVVELFHAVSMSASSAGGWGEKAGPTEGILSAFNAKALLLLQQLNYALTHPNQLASLLEPVTAEERMAAEKDQTDGQASAGTAVVDPVKRPFLARLVHRLFGLTSNIVCTLMVINKSDTVLRGDIEDVPTWCPLVVPHSKVVLGEPASIGTLLELASSALDVLSHLVARPAGQALAPPSSISTSVRGAERALDVGEALGTARRSVEAVLLYGTTQLGMWLVRPEGVEGGDGEMEEMGEGGERRREPAGLSERVRRGMVVEMGGELRAVVEKARVVLGRSRGGDGKETVELTEVLLRFLNEHVLQNT